MRWFLIMALFAGCPKASLEPALPEGAGGVIWVSRTPTDSGGQLQAPQVLFDGLVDALAVEGLLVKPLAPGDDGSALVSARSDADRILAVVGDQVTEGIVVLVETRASFFSQLEGRYRWVVNVRAGVAEASAPGAGVVEVFDVPVFLQFEHQNEAEAVAAAEPVISRHVQRLLRRHLGAEPAGW